MLMLHIVWCLLFSNSAEDLLWLSMERDGNNGEKIKGLWRHRYVGGGRCFLSSGLLGGFSFLPRSYACSFCKKEFKSAQALGGHMNVHRRDRARLRQSLPWYPSLYSPIPDLNLIPNPRTHTFPHTLNFSPPLPATTPFEYFSSSPSSAGQLFSNGDALRGSKEVKTLFRVGGGMGRKLKDMEEDLDLELRLWYNA